MDFLTLFFVFIFGTLIGSFLNVIIYRYNTGASPISGRSQCFSCGKDLSWYELVPLVSFFMQKGRCASCSVRLSWQYPIVEALSGLLAVWLYLQHIPLFESVYLGVVFAILLIIAVYDIRHQIIPDGLVLIFAVVSFGWFIYTAGYPEAFDFPSLWTIIAGPALFLPFWFLWWFSEGKWIGLGDGKLALGMGWFLGLAHGASAVVLAFWIGAGWALSLMGLQRLMARYAPQMIGWNLTMQSEIPFGPFLIIATFVVYFTQMNMFDGTFMAFAIF